MMKTCDNILSWKAATVPFPPCYPLPDLSFALDKSVSFNFFQRHNISFTGGIAYNQTDNFWRWHNVLRSLNERDDSSTKNLTVVFLGGSMLAGHMDKDFLEWTQCAKNASGLCGREGPNLNWDCKECAYPARFGTWLQKQYPDVNVQIHNMGIGGSVSRGILNVLGPALHELPHIDVVFLQWVTNDVVDHNVDDEAVIVGYETLIRFLLSLKGSKTAVIDLPMLAKGLGNNNDFGGNSMVWKTHERVTKHYHIPILPIEIYTKEPVVPNINTTAACPHNQSLPLWLKNNAHPAWPYHQVVAHFLSFAWAYQLTLVCQMQQQSVAGRANQAHNETTITLAEGFSIHAWDDGDSLPSLIPSISDEVRSLHNFCILPLSAFDAKLLTKGEGDGCDKYDLAVSGTNSTKDQWHLGEDVVGKPGWWIDAVEGANISFKMLMSDMNPIIAVGYLSSYHGMGTVAIHLDDDISHKLYINALTHGKHVSMLRFQSLCLNQGNEANTPGGILTRFATCNGNSTDRIAYGGVANKEKNNKRSMHTLHFELISNLNHNRQTKVQHHNNTTNNHHKNKFKITSIVSC